MVVWKSTKNITTILWHWFYCNSNSITKFLFFVFCIFIGFRTFSVTFMAWEWAALTFSDVNNSVSNTITPPSISIVNNEIKPLNESNKIIQICEKNNNLNTEPLELYDKKNLDFRKEEISHQRYIKSISDRLIETERVRVALEQKNITNYMEFESSNRKFLQKIVDRASLDSWDIIQQEKINSELLNEIRDNYEYNEDEQLSADTDALEEAWNDYAAWHNERNS